MKILCLASALLFVSSERRDIWNSGKKILVCQFLWRWSFIYDEHARQVVNIVILVSHERGLALKQLYGPRCMKKKLTYVQSQDIKSKARDEGHCSRVDDERWAHPLTRHNAIF